MPKMIRLFLITALILTVFLSGMDVSADTAENFQEITEYDVAEKIQYIHP